MSNNKKLLISEILAIIRCLFLIAVVVIVGSGIFSPCPDWHVWLHDGLTVSEIWSVAIHAIITAALAAWLVWSVVTVIALHKRRLSSEADEYKLWERMIIQGGVASGLLARSAFCEESDMNDYTKLKAAEIIAWLRCAFIGVIAAVIGSGGALMCAAGHIGWHRGMVASGIEPMGLRIFVTSLILLWLLWSVLTTIRLHRVRTGVLDNRRGLWKTMVAQAGIVSGIMVRSVFGDDELIESTSSFDSSSNSLRLVLSPEGKKLVLAAYRISFIAILFVIISLPALIFAKKGVYYGGGPIGKLFFATTMFGLGSPLGFVITWFASGYLSLLSMFLPLAWYIPMFRRIRKVLRYEAEDSFAFALCCLLFFNVVSGMLMLASRKYLCEPDDSDGVIEDVDPPWMTGCGKAKPISVDDVDLGDATEIFKAKAVINPEDDVENSVDKDS